MEHIRDALAKIEEINNRYEISNDSVAQLLHEMEDAKVCTPIIGKFSSGKSALVNTLLGWSTKLLKEDITPETAVPAEVVYSDFEDSVTVVENNGQSRNISVEEYREFEADASTVQRVRINLQSAFLKKIPDIMLVDMPGFDSGFEIHNKAIDSYLPQSSAYIIAFPADDMIVRSSVGNILKELCLNEMPLCIVITKYDKRSDEFETTFEHLKESLKRFVGDRELRYCRTSSFDGDAEELEEFLTEIQEESQHILERRFAKPALQILENTENYLKTSIKSSGLSKSELEEQEEELQGRLQTIDKKFSKEQDDFNAEISECVEEIKDDVKTALEADESTLVTIVMNNQNLNERLNTIVRNAVTASVKKRFVSKVEKYLRRVKDCINGEDIGDIYIPFHYDPEKVNKGITSSVVAVAAGLLLGLPVLGVIAAFALRMFGGSKRREEMKQEIRGKLRGEVFPQVLAEVGRGIESAIKEQINLVNTSIEEDIATQKETLKKALSDVKSKMEEEKFQKESFAMDVEKDLERIGELKDGLR